MWFDVFAALLRKTVLFGVEALLPFPLATLSKALVCGHSLTGIAGLNPPRGMDVCCCVLSGGGLCVGLNTRPEESYRVWCV
jgi:hypothetical protein